MIGECRVVICGGSRHPHAPGNTPAGCRCGGSLCKCGAGCPGTPAAGPKRHSAPHPAAHCTGTRCHGLDTHLADAALHASQHVLTRCRPGWGAANPVCGMHRQASRCWGLRYQCVECISIGNGCRTSTVVTCSLPEQAAALYNQCVECIPTFTVMTCWSPGPAAALRSAMPTAARCAPAGSIQSWSPYMKVTGTWRRTPMGCEPGNPVQFCAAAACTARMLHVTDCMHAADARTLRSLWPFLACLWCSARRTESSPWLCATLYTPYAATARTLTLMSLRSSSRGALAQAYGPSRCLNACSPLPRDAVI